jgi:hypothetical protein
MALDNELVSLLTPRQRALLEEFDSLVEKAETSKDEPTPVADFVKATRSFLKTVDAQTDEATAAIRTVLGPNEKARQAAAEDAAVLIDGIRAIVDALSPKVEVTDRAAGDEITSKVAHNLVGDGYEVDAEPMVQSLLDRWKTARGVSSSNSSSNYVKPDALGFRVYTVCQIEGCKDPRTGRRWEQYTEKENVNSLRHYAIKHLREEHQIELSPRKGGSPARFDALTAGIQTVFGGEERVTTDEISIRRSA